MPAMPLIAFSIGMMTEDVISSGEAPGSRSCTLTWAGSAFGKRSTPRSRNEKMPSTTSDITSIVAKTGRRTQISESILFPARLFPGGGADLQAVDQLVHVRHRHRLAGVDATDDLDAIAQTLTHL